VAGATPAQEMPYRAIDTCAALRATADWFPDRDELHALLVTNPAQLYGFD
jgi:predicted TIM-barrel fold metal-dependent hydrolase